MPSLGEISISVNNLHDAVKISIQDIIAAPAIYPRLLLNIGIILAETKDGASYPLKDYELIDLEGELRLSENNATIGTIRWSGQRHQHKSSTVPREHRTNLFCDLDPWRIEQIEQHRDGREPTFWIQLWPTLAGGDYFTNIQTWPTRITIPRDKWIKILEGIGYGDFEIVEITRGEIDKELYSRAISHLKEAEDRLNHGDYDGCLVDCRKAIEAMVKATPKGEGKQVEAFKAVLVEQLGANRAEYLTGIISRVKEWTNVAAHSQGQPVEYTRSEAVFILNSTINLLHLIGGLS